MGCGYSRSSGAQAKSHLTAPASSILKTNAKTHFVFEDPISPVRPLIAPAGASSVLRSEKLYHVLCHRRSCGGAVAFNAALAGPPRGRPPCRGPGPEPIPQPWRVVLLHEWAARREPRRTKRRCSNVRLLAVQPPRPCSSDANAPARASGRAGASGPGASGGDRRFPSGFADTPVGGKPRRVGASCAAQAISRRSSARPASRPRRRRPYPEGSRC